MIFALLALSATITHEFVFTSKPGIKSVAVVGTFNSWNAQADPMILDGDGRTWRKSVALAPGKISYKFVIEGRDWVVDPKALRNEDDGNGNINSILILLPPGYEKPAVQGDGIITVSAISHSQAVPDLNFDRGRLTLTLSVRTGDVRSVSAVVNGKKFSTETISFDELTEKHRCSVAWDGKSTLRYHFLLSDGGPTIQYGPEGISSSSNIREYVISPSNFKPFQVTKWVERSIFYQIFPERFADGDPTNNPPGFEKWNATPKYDNFFGGDMEGVDQHLAYLQGLGANAIYLNPIFASPSNHGYETSDYLRVEPRFGGNKAFETLAADMHQRGMKVVIDGVFNHTATNFFAFTDLLKNQQESSFKDWYFVNRYPVAVTDKPNYEAWYGFRSMPKLHVQSPEVEKYLLGVVKFWNKDVHLDGWRLDAANEVAPSFWRKFRAEVKGLNPQAWILGEIWGDGTPWLSGDQFDATMNYLFRNVAIQGIAKNQGSGLDVTQGLMKAYNLYAPQVSRNQLNLLGSHDTPRFLTECGGDKQRAKLGALLQMTWVGAPSVYYGDELGMEGAADPDNRRAMRWDIANSQNNFLTYYKQLIAIRRSSEALLVGDPVPLQAVNQQNLVTYGRITGNDAAFIAINRSTKDERAEIRLPQNFRSALTNSVKDALSGRKIAIPKSGVLSLTVPAQSGVILLPMR